MSKILELREKRAKAWDAAKAFLDAKRGADGMLSEEDTAAYDKMEQDVMNLGKEIERLERQAAIDAELSKATSTPLTGKPGAKMGKDEKTGRASDEYKGSFWNAMRVKVPAPSVLNALQEGTDSGVLPVKRTMKNNNFFSVSLLTGWRYFYAAFNVSS